MTPAERYAARKTRVARNLRSRTIRAADGAVCRAQRRRRYGDHWEDALRYALDRQLQARYESVERNPYRSPSDPETGYWRIGPRPFLRPANPRELS